MVRALIAIDYDDKVEEIIATCREWSANAIPDLIVLGIAPDLEDLASHKRLRGYAKSAQSALLEDLRHRVARVCAAFGSLAESHITCGETSDEIIKAAILHNVDFVMKSIDVGSDGHSGRLGKVAKTLIRKCPVPVWLLSPTGEHPPQRICVAIDNIEKAADASEATILALSLIRHAADLAQRFNMKEITLLHAWSAASTAFLRGPRAQVSPDDIADFMDECEGRSFNALNNVADLAEAQISHLGVAIKKTLVMGAPHLAIPNAASDLNADILVIGSANRSGIMGLLVGNTAETILDRMGCSVFVVKPEGLSALISAHIAKPLSQAS